MTFAPEPVENQAADPELLASKKPNLKVLVTALLLLPCVLVPLLRLPTDQITANGTFNLLGFFLIAMVNVAFWTLFVHVSRTLQLFFRGSVLASALHGLLGGAFVVGFIVAIVYVLNTAERNRRLRAQELEDEQNPYVQTQKAIQGLKDDIEKQNKKD